ncbi:cytochrome P450 [Nocardioides lianchengensis]|uniref:Cytochrome P450 n=1 Tax=Nocardioides lianchengensis TaxID=1045774 RepID=A0A1G6SLU5_9ACTN|nr:cytochrome P450 [Nocardioides lianchengensis]NYG09885.1 hypothetical protein [Nocardioides lianchengensis]SDD17611.1 Cytochrome P450 [Nocardioides lianchengensis]
MRLAPGGPVLVPSFDGARTVLTDPDRFVLPFDVSRRAVRRHGRSVPKDTTPLPADAVALGREVFARELARAAAGLGPESTEVDTLVLLREPVGRSTTAALLPDLDPVRRDGIADLVVAWVDALGPVISAQRPPGRWSRVRRTEQRSWRALLAGLRAAGVPGPAAVATALAAGVQVPIAAGSWCLTLLAADPDLQDRLRAEPGLVLPFVWEVLRLYPPTWLLARITASEVEVDGTRLPPYTPVVVSPVALGRLPRLVPGPDRGRSSLDRLDPDRWTGSDVRPGAWLAFGAGPHACPGRSLGLAQLTLLTSWATTTDLEATAPLQVDTDRGLSPRPSAVVVSAHAHPPGS